MEVFGGRSAPETAQISAPHFGGCLVAKPPVCVAQVRLGDVVCVTKSSDAHTISPLQLPMPNNERTIPSREEITMAMLVELIALKDSLILSTMFPITNLLRNGFNIASV